MGGEADPYTVLGVVTGVTDAEVHRAYRAAVRRTHPDAGGDAAAFGAVQSAYETLRDPHRRRAWDTAHASAPPRQRPPVAEPDLAGRSMEDLLAESQRLEAQARRLEDEARRLAGLAPRHGRDGAPLEDDDDTLGAVARDAGKQLRDAAEKGADELRRIVRRWL
jgi:curved DNA-binding protein CbpA